MEKPGHENGAEGPEEEYHRWICEVEKEIIENITQCLCLAKMQMSLVQTDHPEEARALIGEARLLLGKAVQDLRKLVKQFRNPA